MRFNNRLSKHLFIATLTLVISACGFHLRNSYNLPKEIQTLSVTSFDPYGNLAREMKIRLQLFHINLTKPSDEISNLHLISESYGENTLSLYQNATIAQRQFSYSVGYAVTVPEKGTYNFSVQLNRTFLDNPLTALAKSVEVEMLTQEMRIEATKQIMRQLGRISARIEEFDKKQAEELALKEQQKNAAGENIDIEIKFEGKEPKGKPLSSYIKEQ